MAESFSFEKPYGAKVDTPRPVKSQSMETKMIEGYTHGDLTSLYNEMGVGENTKRKYDMDDHVSYSRYHPEYYPDGAEKLVSDSEQVIQQQMITMGITLVATASLAIIIFMVSNTASTNT